MTEALGLGEAQLKHRRGLSEEALEALGTGLGFDTRDNVFITGSHMEFATWYNDHNTYDGGLAQRGSRGLEPAAPSGLICKRKMKKPYSCNERLITVELRSVRNDAMLLPWPLQAGFTFGSCEVDGIDFFVRAGRLRFDFGDSSVHTALAGDRGAFPGNLVVVPSDAAVTLTPDGHGFQPEWIFQVDKPIAIAVRNLIEIDGLQDGDVVETGFFVPIKDLTPVEKDTPSKPSAQARGKTHAFVWKTPDRARLPARDAKAALLAHVSAKQLLPSEDGEACLARDALMFVAAVTKAADGQEGVRDEDLA